MRVYWHSFPCRPYWTSRAFMPESSRAPDFRPELTRIGCTRFLLFPVCFRRNLAVFVCLRLLIPGLNKREFRRNLPLLTILAIIAWLLTNSGHYWPILAIIDLTLARSSTVQALTLKHGNDRKQLKTDENSVSLRTRTRTRAGCRRQVPKLPDRVLSLDNASCSGTGLCCVHVSVQFSVFACFDVFLCFWA